MKVTGKQLRTALLLADLTQEGAADKLGVSRQTVNNWCRLAEIPQSVLTNVKEILGIEVEGYVLPAKKIDSTIKPSHKEFKITGNEFKRALRIADISQDDAANRINVSRQTLSTWIGRAELDDKILQKIKEGLGSGFLDSTLNKVPILKQANKVGYNDAYESTPVKPDGVITKNGKNHRKETALIPFYNADFLAGNAEKFYDDATIYPEYYMDVPEFYGCTAFRAYSDSMEPKIKSGSILFGIKRDEWQQHLEYGQIYGITCTDGRRYLKYIRKAKDEAKSFLLKSENPNYDDFELAKSKIKNIWQIEGWLDKRT